MHAQAIFREIPEQEKSETQKMERVQGAIHVGVFTLSKKRAGSWSGLFIEKLF